MAQQWHATSVTRPGEPGADLHEASGVAGDDHGCARRCDVSEFRRKHEIRDLGLDEVVNARTPTALLRVSERHELEVGNGR